MHGTATGSAHLQHHQPCEDAAASHTVGPWTVVAVADGHGSTRHPRAARGADLAVRTATEALGRLSEGDLEATRAALKEVPEQIYERWREQVLADVTTEPLTAGEGRAVGGHDLAAALRAHGTTLLAAAACRQWLVVLQLGDGDILIGRDADAAAGRPTRPAAAGDPRFTDSLCQSDAADLTRVAVVDLLATPVPVVLLATDGFGAAFERPDWHDETMQQLVSVSREVDDEALADAVSQWCREPARVGGDDVALGVLVAREAPSTGTSMTEGQDR